MNYILANGNTTATLFVADADGNLIKADGLEVSNVPLKANYRTNILGNLFTSQVITNINVDPAFEDNINKAFVSVTAESIENANALIAANTQSDIIEVKFAASPEDISQKAILTTNVKESGTLNIEVTASVTDENQTLYVGDYTSEDVTETMTLSEDAKSASVNITIAENTSLKKVVVNASTKTVTFNGAAVSDGTYSIEELIAATSATTLIIEKGQRIKHLTFQQGGLEIHGTVKEVEVKGTTENVFVRECENLAQAVYEVLDDYLASGYKGVQNSDRTWDIVAPVNVGGKGYATLKDAIDAAGEGATITLVNDITLSDKLIINTDKTLVIDLNGQTLSGRTNIERGNITFKNGYIVAEGETQALNVYGSTDTAAKNYTVLNVAKDVTVTAGVYAVCIFGNTPSSAGYGTLVNIDGTIKTQGDGKNGAVFVSGNLNKNVDGNFQASAANIVNINGSVTSETDAAVALNGGATVNINEGAVIKGNTALAVKRGKLVVNGGTVTGNGKCYSYPDPINNNGSEMTGSAVSATDTYSEYGPLSVEIKGGEFTSAAYTILNNSSCDFNISGGSFKTTLEKYAIAVYARLGSVNISGGEFENSSNYEATIHVGCPDAVTAGKQPKLTISGDDTVVKNTAEGSYARKAGLAPLAVNMANNLTYKAVNISGGTFYGNNPSQDDSVTTEYGNFLAEGYAATETESGSNIWKVAKK